MSGIGGDLEVQALAISTILGIKGYYRAPKCRLFDIAKALQAIENLFFLIRGWVFYLLERTLQRMMDKFFDRAVTRRLSVQLAPPEQILIQFDL